MLALQYLLLSCCLRDKKIEKYRQRRHNRETFQNFSQTLSAWLSSARKASETSYQINVNLLQQYDSVSCVHFVLCVYLDTV